MQETVMAASIVSAIIPAAVGALIGGAATYFNSSRLHRKQREREDKCDREAATGAARHLGTYLAQCLVGVWAALDDSRSAIIQVTPPQLSTEDKTRMLARASPPNVVAIAVAETRAGELRSSASTFEPGGVNQRWLEVSYRMLREGLAALAGTAEMAEWALIPEDWRGYLDYVGERAVRQLRSESG